MREHRRDQRLRTSGVVEIAAVGLNRVSVLNMLYFNEKIIERWPWRRRSLRGHEMTVRSGKQLRTCSRRLGREGSERLNSFGGLDALLFTLSSRARRRRPRSFRGGISGGIS